MLWQMDPTARFSDRADVYDRFRPSYPEAVIEALLEDGPREIADIGAGPGISCRPFLERELRVFAVEPNAAMRAAGPTHPLLTWLEATAEATGLSDASVDLVTCFQSFHWFEPVATMNELTRILRPGGTIAAVFNERDETDPFTRAYGDIVRNVSNHHPAEDRATAAERLTHESLSPKRHEVFANAQSLDREGLLGRAASTSYLPKNGPAHTALVDALEALFESWQANGRVTLRYACHLYRAVSVAPPGPPPR